MKKIYVIEIGGIGISGIATFNNNLPKVFNAVAKMPGVTKEKVEKLREIYSEFM